MRTLDRNNLPKDMTPCELKWVLLNDALENDLNITFHPAASDVTEMWIRVPAKSKEVCFEIYEKSTGVIYSLLVYGDRIKRTELEDANQVWRIYESKMKKDQASQ